MIKRLILTLGLGAAALTVPTISSTATVGAAGADQISVWKASGMQQTANSYWEPNLNQPADYTKPVNYADGRAYIKIEVVTKPSDLFVKPAICFWRHDAKRFQYETCAKSKNLGFTDKGTYYFDLDAPNNFWKKNGNFDWSEPPSLGRIMIKKGADGPTQLLMNSRCGAACYKGDDLFDHIPIKMNSELIFVAKGKKLVPPSDWRSDCPASWSSQCNGGGTPPPATQPPTTQPPTTQPPTTQPPTTQPPTTQPPTTQPGDSTVKVTPGIGSLTVAHRIPSANKYQLRYQPANGKRVWTEVTTETAQVLDGLTAGVVHSIDVRGLINGVWQPWISTTGTPLAAGGGGGGGGGTPGSGAGTSASVDATSSTPAFSLTSTAAGFNATWQHDRATKYQLNYREDGTSSWTRFSPTPDTSQNIKGLTSGQDYEVRIRALIGGTWKSWTSLTVTAGG